MSLEQLCAAVEAGEQEKSRELAQALVEGGTDPLEIISALTGVMGRIGERFSRLEIFLPEMMLSGESMAGVVEVLSPVLKDKDSGSRRGKILLGTVKGDLHEIGKNIVKLMLESNLFEVRDIGVDADAVDFIRAAGEMDAQVIGASALMSTTLPHQKEIIDILKEKGLRDRYKIVVGGAPTTQEWSDEIGADLYCPDAGSASAMITDMLT
jgi:methylmalonyl-CoA mutase cobalamin-binding domain/chain